MTLPFELPKPFGFQANPVWSDEGFICQDQSYKVLEYSENFSGWSDDLTAIHEAAAGDSHPIDVASREDALLQVSQSIKAPGAVIMEIGCSSGYLIHGLVAKFDDAVVIGADVVRAPLYKLADALPNVPLIRFDLLQNPLPKSCIDILVMLNVLEHIDNDLQALSNAYSLLKPGGALIIEVPAGKYLYDSYDKQLHHYRRYSAFELQSKLESVGFVISRKSHLGFFLFPAFALVKLVNKLRGDSKNIVQQQAANTSSSRLVLMLMRLESRVSEFVSFPFGIRVLMTAKRPE